MALQSSGPISISQIKTELSSSSNSLRALSALANKSTPDSMSEFYGFSAATAYTFLTGDAGNGYGDWSTACAEAYDPITLYSSSTSLANNVTLYTDNTLTSVFVGNGWYKSGTRVYEIGNDGKIISNRAC